MDKKLVVSEIYEEKTENENIRVCSKIKSDKEDYTLWFEVEKRYKEYILLERADSFLVVILPYAIKHELDIYIENSVSSKLYYQLTTYLVPTLCERFKKRQINISCNSLDNGKYNIGKAVGTGISRGVDSLYTIAKHTRLKTKEFNITHLTLFNAGATGEYGGDKARELYNQKIQEGKKFAKENKFDFLSVDSNMNEFLMMDHMATHTFRSLACVLLLQKLFSIYYYASVGYNFNHAKITIEDGPYDDAVLPYLSTEDITFYSSGIETDRMGKVKELVNYRPSYKMLNVCLNEENNCGFCSKCMRTILEIYATGKLDLYKDVFDVDKFNKKRYKYFIYLMKEKRKKDDFCMQIYEEFKKQNIKIPIFIKLLAFIPNKKEIEKAIFKIIPKNKIKNFLGKKPSFNDGWID